MRVRRELFTKLDAELSGERAHETTRQLTRFYRSIGSSGYHHATNLVAETLASHGIPYVQEVYPLDGETVFLNTRMPLAWEPFGAELRMVEPATEHLVSYDEAPSCIIWWSSPTPPEGVVCDVVDVGTGQSEVDFQGKDIQGKAIFARGTPETDSWESWGRVAQLAARHKAQGVITDYLIRQAPPDRTRENLPDAVQLLRFPPDLEKTWGISISYVASQKLSLALTRGPVKVYANVQCRVFVGHAVNLTATIEGRDLPHESVYFCAHVTAATKPAANCAEGVALAAEVARVFQKLIKDERIRRPRRSIKFLFLAEQRGSAFFFDRHPERSDSILMCFNYCSVGHSQSKLNSVLMFYKVPDSVPSFVNDFCLTLMEEVPKEADWVGKRDRRVPLLNFIQVPYVARSDNGVWNQCKVPTAMIWSSPNRYFHTQFLTAELSDPRVFRRAGLVTAAAAYEVADADERRAEEILVQIQSHASTRMWRVAAHTARELSDSLVGGTGLDVRQHIGNRAMGEIDYLLARDSAAMRSLLRFVRSDPEAFRERLSARIKEAEGSLSRIARELGNYIRSM